MLVVGAGDAGAIVVREMQRNAQLGMQPVGFLDDDPVKIGKRIYDVPVVGGLPDLQAVVIALRVDEVVIAMPRAWRGGRPDGRRGCRQAGVVSRTMPGVFELLDGEVSVSRLRKVDITDLLRRDPVLGGSQAADYLEGRAVLVTGAGGRSARSWPAGRSRRPRRAHAARPRREQHLRRRSRAPRGFPHVPLSTVIADIRDERRMHQVFDRISRPSSSTRQPTSTCRSWKRTLKRRSRTTSSGRTTSSSRRFARARERLVLISTDKAVAPSSIMGATKRIAEAIVREAAQRSGRAFVAVRFGNVLGSRGSVVNTFKEQIERGGPITVTHPDMTRFFMTIPEAVHLVLQASGRGPAASSSFWRWASR